MDGPNPNYQKVVDAMIAILGPPSEQTGDSESQYTYWEESKEHQDAWVSIGHMWRPTEIHMPWRHDDEFMVEEDEEPVYPVRLELRYTTYPFTGEQIEQLEKLADEYDILSVG